MKKNLNIFHALLGSYYMQPIRIFFISQFYFIFLPGILSLVPVKTLIHAHNAMNDIQMMMNRIFGGE